MIVTKYVCDRCGHEQDTENQMWSIGVACDYRLFSSYQNSDMRLKALWCRPCAVEFNLLPPDKTPAEPHPKPSIEDIIREIMREEIAAATGAQ